MSKNYLRCLNLKPYYSHENFVYLCKKALEKKKITEEEYVMLVSDEQDE